MIICKDMTIKMLGAHGSTPSGSRPSSDKGGPPHALQNVKSKYNGIILQIKAHYFQYYLFGIETGCDCDARFAGDATKMLVLF
jgi:hypothetical protein